jgi:predicted Fe-S protein YdhL (DUF1289 family)
MSTPRTPCIKVCVMDPARNVCLGCCRTLDEIACWCSMSEAERARVMAGLNARRKALDVPDAEAIRRHGASDG